MRQTTLTVFCFALLSIAGLWWSRPVFAASEAGQDAAITAAVRDYQAVRKVAMALAVLGYLFGVAHLRSDSPGDVQRAQGLITFMTVAFVLLAADRMIVRGVAEWFHINPASIPAPWR